MAHSEAGPALGPLIRGYRMRSGLTQAELAGRAGLSVRGLRDLESGRSNRPHLASVRRLTEALGLCPSERASLLAHVGAAPPGPVAPATSMETTVGILGPLVIRGDGHRKSPGAPMLRNLLGTLALYAPGPVATDVVIAHLWGDHPPPSARGQVHVRVGQLRRLLPGPEPVERAPDGYRLRTGLDASTFRALVTTAARALTDGDRRGARDHYARALRLWRGPVLADVGDLRHHPAAVALTALRVEAAIAHAGLAGPADRPEAVRWLRSLAADDPLHEGLAAALTLTLAAAGEQAAALATFDAVRARLREDLGIEPGPDLRAAHLRILRAAGSATDRPVPAQLPPAINGFVGRSVELAALDAALPRGAAGGAPVVVVSGTAGVGKTSLAVWWAHRVGDRFPDGQLYVNLRGYDPDGPALDPADAARGFLDALGVTPERMPDGLDARVGLYRSLLHGRRILVLLDNARDAAHVRPLLAGAPTSVTVVTSRDRLGGLIATAGARPVPLDLLPPVEACDLLVRRLGRARVDADPGAADEIVDRCAGLPLALAVVAAYAAGRPAFPLTAIARDLATGPSGDEVRTVLSWSYRGLPPAQARLFRLLAVHPGPDLDVAAAASLLGAPVGDARSALHGLAEAHLVTEHVPGRYSFHDLLRAYAATLAAGDPAGSTAAVRRVADHYLRAVTGIDHLESPQARRLPAVPAGPGVTTVTFTGHDRGQDWLDTELPVLLAVIAQAARAGLDAHVWQFAWGLWRYFEFRGRLSEWCATQELALASARRLGDPLALELTHRGYAFAYARLNRYDDALGHLDRAVAQHEVLADPAGLARLTLSRSWITGLRGDHREALGHAERALAMFEELGDRRGVVHALASAGRHLVDLGDPGHALDVLGRAWDLHQDLVDPYGRADTLDQLGRAHLRRGGPRTAAGHFTRAAALHREIGDRYSEADAYHWLGDAHRAAGDVDAARAAWSAALDLLDELCHDDATVVRGKLTRTPGGPAGRQKAADNGAPAAPVDGARTRTT
ncbi:BTAD domain-containing putative transcriptional regulator [Virgisporangium ochraceum]|uniref:SARP family transcriptional regulator n=1 Tax=Virgisporangium ochraceum TaxID=65505 RepID=A0A8J3ZNZ7_9ACTN|nr:BTAD domain-containing putative transcriptional regulator [Virgisporangium ochraceum]GIJ67186.1 SARP family transcriptional regulator [Virgisporangium ochraceum]